MNLAGKSLQYDQKMGLINGTEIISNPQNISDMLKSSCVRIIGEHLNQNGCHVNVQISQQMTNFCPNNIHFSSNGK